MASFCAGVDAGAATVKAVIIQGDSLVGYSIIPSGAILALSAHTVMERVLKEANITMEDLDNIVATAPLTAPAPYSLRQKRLATEPKEGQRMI